MGFHRQRDLARIIPASPFKPGKEERLAEVVSSIRSAIASASGRASAPSRGVGELG